MPSSHPLPTSCHWSSRPAAALDPRSAPRRAWRLVGAILARGRRAVTRWTRAAGLSPEYRPGDTTVSAAGERADGTAARLAHGVVRPLLAGMTRLVFALDDTPTPRSGPLAQGAGVHHDPTPGPAGSRFVYGHVRVVLGLLAAHPAWGVLALPLLARLSVRRANLGGIDPEHRPAFRAKLALAVELVRWAVAWLGFLGRPVWVVVDGAYAQAPVLEPVIGPGVTVVRRLRKDAALRAAPGPRRPGRRGRRRVYGVGRSDRAERAGPRRGWVTGTATPYGKPVAKRYETFVATWRPVGGAIRVVLVGEPSGWAAFFCTDPAAGVADILGCVADRSALETAFKGVKAVVGAGQQQVRFVWAGVGSFHVCLWAFTRTECRAWDRGEAEWVGHRGASPWDDEPRRPSHADKRRERLGEEIRAVLRPGATARELAAAAERPLNLAA